MPTIGTKRRNQRKNQIVVEAAREMLEEKSMSKVLLGRSHLDSGLHPESDRRGVCTRAVFWEEAKFKTPKGILQHVPDEKRRKLDMKSEKCILVGDSQEQKGYKCYNL